MSRLKTDAIRNVNASVDGITLDTSGNVVIPEGLLHIGGTDHNANSGADDLIIGTTSGTDNHGITIKSPTNKYGRLYFADGNSSPAWHVGQIEYNHSDNSLVVYTAGSERLRITSDGKLGVGDSSPSVSAIFKRDQTTHHYLRVENLNSSSNYTAFSLKTPQLDFQLWNQGPGGSGYGGANSVNFYQGAATGPYCFFHGTAERLRINTNGNVGIGITSPTQKLDVAGSLQLGNGNAIGFGDQSARIIGESGASGILRFDVNGGEKARITSDGKVLIGGGSSPAQVGDGQLIVYADTRLHPAIKADCIDGGSNRANGFTMLADNYAADESVCNIGLAYSSASLVLSRGCKVSNTVDNAYLSSIDTFACRPCALRLDNDGALSFNTTETNATTTTDSAVSLTEVFKVDKVGNIYQRITGRFLYMGASNQLQMGVASSGDGYLNSVSGDLKIADAGNPITIVRSDGFQMYQDIYFATAGKGICLGTTSNTDANTLEDYEEGNLTWYLRKSDNTSGGNDNGSIVKYTKVGRLVHISGRIRTDSVSSGSNYVFHLDGSLPFTPSTPGTSVVGHWRSQDQLDSSLTASICWGESNTTIYLYTIDSKSDYSPSANNVPASHQTNLVMTFSFTYQAS